MKFRNKVLNYSKLFLLFLMVFIAQSCRVSYSLNNATIDYEKVQTISVQEFFNESGGGPPDLAFRFTQSFKDYFLQNTNLTDTLRNGDLQFEGAITRYSLRPAAPRASTGNTNGQISEEGLTRLDVSVSVSFLNLTDETQEFTQNFSGFDTFDPSTQSLSAVEDDLLEEIFEQIISNVFSASVANW